MRPLICESCGGPLPRPSPSTVYLTCAFCDTTTAVGETPAAPIAPAAQVSAVQLRTRHEAAFGAFEAELSARQQSVLDKAGFVAAASALAALCDPDSLANVVFALVAEFSTTHGVDLTKHPNAVARVATAYLGGLPDIRAHGQASLKIPFITTTSAGPIDFESTVTVRRLRGLVALEPAQAKRGLLGRLFGR